MSESKNIFTNLRDKHGVADLLREVSKRKSALTPKHRREVTDIVDRVDGSSRTSNETSEQNISDDSESSHSNEVDSPTRPVNKWGRDLFQKLSNRQAAAQNPLKPSNEEPQEQRNPRELFRKFSIPRIQNPLKPQQQQQEGGEEEEEAVPSNGDNKNDRRQEIRKSIERSQQQGKEILQKFSTNFQNFSNNVKTSLSIPTNADKAKEISETLVALDKASTHSRAFDKTSNHSRSLDKASNHSIISDDGL